MHLKSFKKKNIIVNTTSKNYSTKDMGAFENLKPKNTSMRSLFQCFKHGSNQSRKKATTKNIKFRGKEAAFDANGSLFQKVWCPKLHLDRDMSHCNDQIIQPKSCPKVPPPHLSNSLLASYNGPWMNRNQKQNFNHFQRNLKSHGVFYHYSEFNIIVHQHIYPSANLEKKREKKLKKKLSTRPNPISSRHEW